MRLFGKPFASNLQCEDRRSIPLERLLAAVQSASTNTLGSTALFASAFLALCGTAVIKPEAALAESTLYVTVRESKLHEKADFFSAAVGDIRYGDALSVVSSSGPWAQVRTSGGKSGYVHQSAVTNRKVVLNAGAGYSGKADANDVVLAGKGFSAEVERQFAANHRNLNFADVNAMERIRVAPKELQSFVSVGQLGKKGS